MPGTGCRESGWESGRNGDRVPGIGLGGLLVSRRGGSAHETGSQGRPVSRKGGSAHEAGSQGRPVSRRGGSAHEAGSQGRPVSRKGGSAHEINEIFKNMQKKTIEEILNETLKVLKEGGVILYPTDTVWGLGCDATNPEAVAKIYEIKHRSDSKSLVLLANSLDQIALYIKEIPPMAIDLVEVNDRPMTLIYPGAKTCPAPVEGEPSKSDRYHLAYNTVAADGTVGIRIPMMEFCQQLTYKLGRPIVSTSANISGEPTPKKFTDISEEIKNAVDYTVDPRLEAGATGLASQIIKIGLDGEVEIIRS